MGSYLIPANEDNGVAWAVYPDITTMRIVVLCGPISLPTLTAEQADDMAAKLTAHAKDVRAAIKRERDR